MPEDTGEYQPNGVSLPVLHPDYEISHLVRQVPDGSPVRCAAERLLAGQALTSLAPLYEALHGGAPGRWAERTVAAWALGRAARTPEDRSDAALALADVLQGRGVHEWRRVLPKAVLVSALLGTLVACLFWHPEWYRGFGAQMLAIQFALNAAAGTLIGLPAVTLLALVRGKRRLDPVRSAAAEALGVLGEPSAIAVLAAECRAERASTYAAARGALVELLDRLTPEHYGTIGPSAMSALGTTLRSRDSLLTSHVLRALEHVGTRASLPELERLATAAPNPGLPDEARRTLDIVRARCDEEARNDRLLRPTDTPAEHLLRPAPNAPAADPDLLLRAAVGEDEGEAQ